MSNIELYATLMQQKFKRIIPQEDKIIINSILKSFIKHHTVNMQDFITFAFTYIIQAPKNCYVILNLYDAYNLWRIETYKIPQNKALEVLTCIKGADKIEHDKQLYSNFDYR